MTGRRAAGLLAALAGAAALLAAWWLLRGEEPAPPAVQGVTPPPPPIRSPEPAPGKGPAKRGAAAPNARTAGAPPRAVSASEPADEPPPAPAKGLTPWARLRLVESGTGSPVPADADPAVTLLTSRGGRALRLPQRVFPQEDGTLGVAVYFGEADRPGAPTFLTDEQAGSARYEVAAYGYAARGGFARKDLEGEREIALDPVAPSAMGILAAGPGLVPGPVRAEIRPADGRPFILGQGVRVPRLPRALGPFAIYDLPDGSWRLDVRVKQPDRTMAHSSREFEKAGATADLGTLEVAAPVAIRARVVAADGTVIFDREISLERTDSPGNSTQGEPLEAQGWVEYRGLEPGAEYRVFSFALGVEQTVRAPGAGAPILSVEIRKDVRVVRCRIRFTVDGRDPLEWGDVFRGPFLEDGAWRKDGTLECDMVPGAYEIEVLARPVGADSLQHVYTRFTVPDRPAWDATVDLHGAEKVVDVEER